MRCDVQNKPTNTSFHFRLSAFSTDAHFLLVHDKNDRDLSDIATRG